MVTVSHEVPAQTEARLRAVFRRSTVDWLPGWWTFAEEAGAVDRQDRIAEIHDEGRVSALVPATGRDERFGVFRVVLPAGADDSGFVGWLATRVKAATGSGLFVICGQNDRRGGIFDFYGVPEAVVAEVREFLAPSRPKDGLDGVVMRMAAEAGGKGTVYCFSQSGESISARYGGGPVAEGWLVGTLDPASSTARFRYLQTDRGGMASSGELMGEIGRRPDGRWYLMGGIHLEEMEL